MLYLTLPFRKVKIHFRHLKLKKVFHTESAQVYKLNKIIERRLEMTWKGRACVTHGQAFVNTVTNQGFGKYQEFIVHIRQGCTARRPHTPLQVCVVRPAATLVNYQYTIKSHLH